MPHSTTCESRMLHLRSYYSGLSSDLDQFYRFKPCFAFSGYHGHGIMRGIAKRRAVLTTCRRAHEFHRNNLRTMRWKRLRKWLPPMNTAMCLPQFLPFLLNGSAQYSLPQRPGSDWCAGPAILCASDPPPKAPAATLPSLPTVANRKSAE